MSDVNNLEIKIRSYKKRGITYPHNTREYYYLYRKIRKTEKEAKNNATL